VTPRQRSYDEVDDKVREDIRTHGWSDMSIFPVKEDGTVAFNYSVGFTVRDHPEVMVMGLDYRTMHGILGTVYEQIKSGTRFIPDTYFNFVLNKHRVAFVEVTNIVEDTEYPMSMSRRIMGPDVKGLQLVWPDENDRFPWDPEFNPKMRDLQPLQGPWRG